jgi:hypothetical protein
MRSSAAVNLIRDLEEILTACVQDAELFVSAVLGVKPTVQQIKGLRAVSRPGAHISIRSGHGTGKSAMLSWIVLWGLLTQPEVKIPCTAPTGHQLFDVLWAELNKWQRRLPDELRGLIQINNDLASVVGAERMEFAAPRTARKDNPEALQGFHGRNLIFVIDEASGVDDAIFTVAEGSLSTPGARVIMASNPTRTSGYFYNSHHRDRKHWTCLHFSCLESPLVDPDYPRRMGEKYGVDSNIYAVRVLGQFPRAEADQFIPLEMLEAAVAREARAEGPMIWGIDPAYLGDDEAVICKRQGDVVTEIVGVRGYNTMQLAGWIIDQYHETKRDRQPQHLVVDLIGVGAGVYDRLRELGYPAVGVNVAESPSSKAKYLNLRVELWARYRDWLESGRAKLPDDADLLAQSSTLKYEYDSTGRLKLESKKDLRGRGLPSPDRADALCLTFYIRPRLTENLTWPRAARNRELIQDGFQEISPW